MDQWVAPGNEDQGNVHKQRLGEKRLHSNPSFPNASPTGNRNGEVIIELDSDLKVIAVLRTCGIFCFAILLIPCINVRIRCFEAFDPYIH